MAEGRVMPSLGAASFNCPHCSALAHQDWYGLSTSPLQSRTIHPTDEAIAKLLADPEIPAEEKKDIKDHVRKIKDGLIFLDRRYISRDFVVYNLYLSQCFSCKKFSVWQHEKIIFPRTALMIEPNVDMPDDIKRDFIEASSILAESPRGSAALLRLCIQKLCIFLGQKGKKIDDDIATLVANGLDRRLQRAFDTVRVIGNEAVHPGQIDLRDSSEIAEKLFKLVNIICEQMISRDKHIDDMYGLVPETKKAAIDKRDGRASETLSLPNPTKA
jgi:hypothetical protein